MHLHFFYVSRECDIVSPVVGVRTETYKFSHPLHYVVQAFRPILPACSVFLLHTALITVGLSSLTARGAIVCTFPVDY